MDATRLPTPPINTWQFFHTCRRLLGDAFLQRLFQRSLRQLQRWASDPAFADSHEPNPIDRYEVLLSRLMEIGREDVARAAVARQAHVVGCELRCLDPVDPSGKSLAEECLDDLPALARYHQVLTAPGSQVEEVRAGWQAAKQELNENYELWVRINAEKKL